MGEDHTAGIPDNQSKDKRQKQTVYLPEELARVLRVTAAEKNCEMSRIAEEALQSYFRSNTNNTTIETLRKVSFYLTPTQIEKLDDLTYKHSKRTERHINRNDIVRHLIDQAGIDDLTDL